MIAEFWNKSFEIPPKGGAPSSHHPTRHYYSSLAWHRTELVVETLPWWCDIFSFTMTHCDLLCEIWFHRVYLWDMLCLNPEHLLDKATIKNDKVEREKYIKTILYHFLQACKVGKKCNRWTEKFFLVGLFKKWEQCFQSPKNDFLKIFAINK